MKLGLMTCYDLRFPELALAQALQGSCNPGTSCRLGSRAAQRSITGQRCLPLVRWIPPVIWWRRGGMVRDKNIGQSRIIDPFGVTIAAASEMPALIMAEVTPEKRVRQVRAQLARLKQPSLCAAAIIMMFFYSALDSPCYRLLLCARVE